MSLRQEIGELGKELIFSFVGESTVVPWLRELLAPYTEEIIMQAVKNNQHIYPRYPAKIRAQWREDAAPFRSYADKVSRDTLFGWFEAARPDLAQAIMRQPKGWQWVVEELELITKDILGE